MSEDGFSDPYDEPSMDLIIETLTGTSFEMRVYPNDTVLDIKNKIYRVEGIPVHHQNLLFQMKELQDYTRLSDIGIVNGCTLKLVLSMRGGPISSRRFNTCDHHIIWKDLKDLIEHTRDELGDKSGSKVSVLVFKEGEVINVIRVIENEDGSYSPYTDKAISPPFHARQKERSDLMRTLFKKMSEDIEMTSKLQLLKSKMKKRQQRHSKPPVASSYTQHQQQDEMNEKCLRESATQGAGDFINVDLAAASSSIPKTKQHPKSRLHYAKDFKLNLNENATDDTVEIALKEKHRSRRSSSDKLRKTNEMYPPTTSDKSYFCENLHIFDPDKRDSDDDELGLVNTASMPLSPIYTRLTKTQYDNYNDGKHAILDDRKTDNTIKLPSAEAIKLTRLIVQEHLREGKTATDSIELDGNGASEMWEIQPETIKSSGAYKVGLLKRRTSVDTSEFGLETSTSNLNIDSDNLKHPNGDYEVFGRNLYHVPHLVSTPSAIPPQYAPKDERICDLYLGSPVPDTKIRRSPLYGRRAKTNSSNIDYNIYAEESTNLNDDRHSSAATTTTTSTTTTQILPKIRTKSENSFNEFASSIECLQNDYTELDYEDLDVDYSNMFGYYNNATNWSDFERFKNESDDAQLANEIKRLSFDLKMEDDCLAKRNSNNNNNSNSNSKVQIDCKMTKLDELPSVVTKKRMRCGQCNKRLNITNIYNCRCGRIFCSQHRYSESHDCKYDYKSEGRKLLQQQNPLVTATKLTKF